MEVHIYDNYLTLCRLSYAYLSLLSNSNRFHGLYLLHTREAACTAPFTPQKGGLLDFSQTVKIDTPPKMTF